MKKIFFQAKRIFLGFAMLTAGGLTAGGLTVGGLTACGTGGVGGLALSGNGVGGEENADQGEFLHQGQSDSTDTSLAGGGLTGSGLAGGNLAGGGLGSGNLNSSPLPDPVGIPITIAKLDAPDVTLLGIQFHDEAEDTVVFEGKPGAVPNPEKVPYVFFTYDEDDVIADVNADGSFGPVEIVVRDLSKSIFMAAYDGHGLSPPVYFSLTENGYAWTETTSGGAQEVVYEFQGMAMQAPEIENEPEANGTFYAAPVETTVTAVAAMNDSAMATTSYAQMAFIPPEESGTARYDDLNSLNEAAPEYIY